jgi:hypothetical protein
MTPGSGSVDYGSRIGAATACVRLVKTIPCKSLPAFLRARIGAFFVGSNMADSRTSSALSNVFVGPMEYHVSMVGWMSQTFGSQ